MIHSLLRSFLLLSSISYSSAASIVWSGSIEHAAATYEAGGDIYNVSVVTQDIFEIPAVHGAAFTVTSTGTAFPTIHVFGSLPNSPSGGFYATTGSGNSRTWVQPAFNPDPDADIFPSFWYLIVSSENELQNRWHDSPFKNGASPTLSYTLEFEGIPSMTLKEGVLILPDGTNGMRGIFNTQQLTAIPEPTNVSLMGLGVITWGLSRRRRTC